MWGVACDAPRVGSGVMGLVSQAMPRAELFAASVMRLGEGILGAGARARGRARAVIARVLGRIAMLAEGAAVLVRPSIAMAIASGGEVPCTPRRSGPRARARKTPQEKPSPAAAAAARRRARAARRCRRPTAQASPASSPPRRERRALRAPPFLCASAR